MRWRPAICAGAIALLAVASSGCGQQQADKLVEQIAQPIVEEMAKDTILRDEGPLILTSVVGASVPTGGPAILNGLCTDAGWRLLIGQSLPELRHVPSPLDAPDPKRPVKISRPRQ
jgi:hypothetical protein